MSAITEWLVIILLVIGSFFLLVGSIGLVRLPDFFSRLHAPTKASTLGIGSILAASALYFSAAKTGLSVKELVITLFLFITAPITAHMLAKAALHMEKRPLARTQNLSLLEPARDRLNPPEKSDSDT